MLQNSTAIASKNHFWKHSQMNLANIRGRVEGGERSGERGREKRGE
jgi:hypothetical protein